MLMLWPAVQEPRKPCVRPVDGLHQRRRRLHHDAADDHPQPDADRAEQHRVLNESHGEASSPSSPSRRIPPCAGQTPPGSIRRSKNCGSGAWCAACRGRQRSGRRTRRIDRRQEAVMQLGAKLPGQLLEDRIVVRGRNHPRDSVRELVGIAAAIGEFRHVEGIAGECHQRRIALSASKRSRLPSSAPDRSRSRSSAPCLVGNDGDALPGSRRSSTKMPASFTRAGVRGCESSGSGRAGRNVRAAGCWSARRP